jgi:hypothetical protein
MFEYYEINCWINGEKHHLVLQDGMDPYTPFRVIHFHRIRKYRKKYLLDIICETNYKHHFESCDKEFFFIRVPSTDIYDFFIFNFHLHQPEQVMLIHLEKILQESILFITRIFNEDGNCSKLYFRKLDFLSTWYKNQFEKT